MLHPLSAWLVLILLLLLGLATLRGVFPHSRPKQPTAQPTPTVRQAEESARAAQNHPHGRVCLSESGVPVLSPQRGQRACPRRLWASGQACAHPESVLSGWSAQVQRAASHRARPTENCDRTYPPVLTALAEGLSLSGAVHTFGPRKRTSTAWLVQRGTHAERLHGRRFRNLQLLAVPLDELRTTLRAQGQDGWIWIACDAITKVIATVQFGPRTQVLAPAVLHAVVQGLASGDVPLFPSDGPDLYVYALTAHLGQWVQAAGEKQRPGQVAAELLDGQVKQSYRRRQLAQVERRRRWGPGAVFQAKVQALGVSRPLNTAFVARLNLTLRRGIAA